MRIAYLACSVTLPGPNRRGDGFEHDRMMDMMRGPFRARGMAIEDVDWADPTVDWSQFDAVVVGTTWDYWDHVDAFLDTLTRIDGVTRLFNTAEVVRWNIDKTYLRELEGRGARLIPTHWVPVVTADAAAAAFDALGDDLVFKRQIGAGAFGQHRLRRGEPLPAMPHPMMVQPFQERIVSEGEYSFVFVDGALSHALVKRAKAGDYRIQSMYGGVETPVRPSSTDLGAAEAILGLLDEMPLYARVDMVRAEDGGLLLMELELIEPYLYPVEGPELGEHLANAVHRRLR